MPAIRSHGASCLSTGCPPTFTAWWKVRVTASRYSTSRMSTNSCGAAPTSRAIASVAPYPPPGPHAPSDSAAGDSAEVACAAVSTPAALRIAGPDVDGVQAGVIRTPAGEGDLQAEGP